MLGISFMILLSAFDQALVGVALPRIVADLQGFALYSWVGTAYLLTTAIALPITGRMGDLYGRKGIVQGAIVVFVIGSFGCARAGSMPMLVLMRALQGVGAGMLIGTTFASVADIFPERGRRMRWQIMIASSFGVANMAGPSLGGFLTEAFGWRVCFLVNLPVGCLAILMVALFLPRVPGTRVAGERTDWLGMALLAALITSVLFAIQEGAARGGLGVFQWPFLVLFATALVLGWWFLRVERRAGQPVLPLRLFDVPAVRALALVSLAGGAALFTLIFYMPLLLQAGFGVAPDVSGFLITPLVGGIAVGSIINGRLFTRIPHPHRLLPAGLGGFAVCLLVIILWVTPGMSHGQIMTVFGCTGVSLGFLFPNLTIQIQMAVARQNVGLASALVQSSRMLGNMTGVAIAGVLVLHGYHAGLEGASTGQSAEVVAALADPQVLVNAATQARLREAASVEGPLALARFDAVVTHARDALIAGVHAGFWVAWVMAVLAFVLACRVPPMPERANAART